MSYENAASTRMIATSCACCGRPLRDAASVEAGVGPDCRKRYGYGEAQGAPDLQAARAELLAAGLEALLDGRDDARACANAVAHAFACLQGAAERVALARACAALGYSTLGRKLGEAVAEVTVSEEGGALVVSAPYVEGGGRAWYRAGAVWDSGAKVWRAPLGKRKQVWGVLLALHSGRIGLGPRGLFVVEPTKR